MSTIPLRPFQYLLPQESCNDPSSSSDQLTASCPAFESFAQNSQPAAPMLSQQQIFSSPFAGGVPIAPRRQQGHMRSMTDTSGYHQPQAMNDFVASLQPWSFDNPMQSIYAFPGDFGMDLARTQSAMDFENNFAAANAQFMRSFGNPTQTQAHAPREAPATPTRVTSTTPVGGTPKTPFIRASRAKSHMSIATPGFQRHRQVGGPLITPDLTDSSAAGHSDSKQDDTAAKPHIGAEAKPRIATEANPHIDTDGQPNFDTETKLHIDTEACLVPTGITEAMISKEMTGPNPTDGHYTCVYEGCGKRFGRKENIRSHVQTHLGDRRYVCPSCEKPFVRAHDLKRHFSIHDGERAYKCQCGNSFARHDALTRHRQRGMCVGAFDGCVKKSQKRGRPRKPRPTDAERQEKSKKTRTKNMSISSIDSVMTQSSYASHESPRPGTRDSDLGFGNYQSFGSEADFDPMATIRPRDYQRMQNSTAPMPSSSQASAPDHAFSSRGVTPQSHVSLEEIENSPLPQIHTPARALSPSDILSPAHDLGQDFTCSPADLTNTLSSSPPPFEVGASFANAMQITEANNSDFAALDTIDFWN